MSNRINHLGTDFDDMDSRAVNTQRILYLELVAYTQ